MSLYGKLFRYRERAKRSPLEDYLTEALADVLNRMPRPVVVDMIANLFLGNEEAQVAWRRHAAGAKSLVWTTQRHIRVGGKSYRLDLLLESDGDPSLVVEGKIGHGVANHAPEPGMEGEENDWDQGGTVDRNQLATYGQWLAGRRRDHPDWPGAIVLLTHRTAAPDDFGCHQATYGVKWQSACRWSRLWRWLSERRAMAEAEVAANWCFLAGELADFIEENNMSAETMTPMDLVAAQVFLGSHDRLATTFERLGASVVATLKRRAVAYVNNHHDCAHYDSEGGAIYAWVYLKIPEGASWYISWGIRFPTISNWWRNVVAEPPIPDQPHAFVAMHSDSSVMPPVCDLLAEDGRPDGWAALPKTHELLVTQELHLLPAQPDEMMDTLEGWITDRIESLIPAIAHLQRLLR